MQRDFPTQGVGLIKTPCGSVSVDCVEADPLGAEDGQKAVGLEGGPFCRVPAERGIPGGEGRAC